ncbi:hypothetical protein M3Y98_00683100 [Aphelenchoides besseyi]|nr:hypothetical protein M3Y98_00683100 [Aphelenchoides besseyi]
MIFTNKLPDALQWDMLGSLFYVGTIFTTIGYGNITPRTKGGQALSMVYALFGIPLVFAILSQFGKTLTNLVSALWVRYHQRSSKKKRPKERKWSFASSRDQIVIQMDESLTTSRKSEEDLDESMESRTIPIWLALLCCILYICICAGLFLIWETRWSYFTSFYFIFISLSTIGLGDVVPDHPHMLILMFWLVIIGLSIVSMLLSVIQIKMEEWLYHLLIKMRKKYHQALENGEILESDQVFNSLLENEPWYMRNIAQALISENQAAKIEEQAETFERTTRGFNNKNIQTDEEFLNPVVTPSTQRSARTGDLPTDPNNPTAYVTAPESQFAEVHQKNELDSDLDASSIPMDFSSSSVRSLTTDLMETCIEEIAVGTGPLDLEDMNRRFFPFELFDQFAQTDLPTRQDVEVECELLIEPTTVQTLDQSENTYATQTAEIGTSISVPKMQDVEIECQVEQKDKSVMTAGPLNVSRGVSVQSRSSNIQRAITMRPPNRSQSDNRLTTAAKKRRRFSLSNAIPNFEAAEDRCTVQTSAVGTQSSWTTLAQRNEVESLDQSVQMTPSLKRRNAAEVGSQKSFEQKPSVAHFGFVFLALPVFTRVSSVQSSPILQHRHFTDSEYLNSFYPFLIFGFRAQYSVEETSELSVQCDPLVNQDVAVQRGDSLDYNDSETSRPTSRTATFQAKEFRSSSTISLQSFELEEPKAIKEKFNLVLQTEDSYLKIARKLDEYRSIRTSQSLHVCATTQDGIESAKRARSARQQNLLSPTSAEGFQFTRKRSSRYKKGERRVSFQQTKDTKIPDQKLKNMGSNLAPDRPETRADSPAVDPQLENKERRLDGYETDDESESAPSMAGEIEIQVPSGRQLKRTRANQEVDWQCEAKVLTQQATTSSAAAVANTHDWSALKPDVQVGIKSKTFTTTEILPSTSDVPLKVMVATSSNVRKSSSAQTATLSNRALRFAEAGVASSSKTSVTSTQKSSESTAMVMATTSPTQSQQPVDFSEEQKRKASLPSLNIPSGIVGGFLKQHDHKSDSNPNISAEKKVAKKRK